MNTNRLPGESDIGFFFRNVGMASFAASIGEICTIPIDTAKVRLQLQVTQAGEKPRYNGFIGTMTTVAAEEGPMSLFNGLVPGLQRQVVFAGLRIGLYVPIRDMITGPLAPGQNPTLLQKILAGMTTGAMGITVANPTDVVKIRLQAQGRLPLAERPYKSSTDCYRQIVAKDGVPGLWVGLAPNIMRNSIINAAEIASYDQYKQIMTQNVGLSPTALTTHVICAFLSGFNACVVGSPVDVLKTRMMNKTPGQPSSLVGIVGDIVRNQGMMTFYKGFTANFMRLGSWNTVMFVTLEQVKNYFDRTYGGSS